MTSSLEFILKLFSISAKQLGVDYVYETPTRLQSWATKHKPPFIALLDINETVALNDAQDNLITYDVAFVVVSSLDKDPTNEGMINAKLEANKLAKDFLWFVKQNVDTTINGFTVSDFFRDNSYLGIGKGFSINLTVPDKNHYCDIYCNTQTKEIDCNR